MYSSAIKFIMSNSFRINFHGLKDKDVFTAFKLLVSQKF